TTKRNRKLLEKALGDDARQVEFGDRARWYRAPASALKRYADFLNEKLAEGASWVRIIGEPAWPAGPEDQIQLWMRYESLVNLAFSAAPTTILCPYDARSVDPEIVRHACLTHPNTIGREGMSESPDYVEPGDFLLAD